MAVELILHAGDVGGPEILEELALIAPVRAVYGNTDAPWDGSLVPALDLTLGGLNAFAPPADGISGESALHVRE